MSEWKSIETAPKDGTEIDVWVVETPRETGRRIIDASWGDCAIDPLAQNGDGGRAVSWRRLGEMYGLSYVERLDDHGYRVTHWMPLPEPPEPTT